MPATTVYGPVTFNVGDPGWAGYTFVHCISASNLAAIVGTGATARFTLEFNSFSAGATAVAWWGESGGMGSDIIDFKGDQKRLTWGGNDTLIGDGTTLIFVSDWITLGEPYDEAVVHNLACEFTGGTVNLLKLAGGSPGNSSFYMPGADAATQNKSTYISHTTDAAILLKQVEIAIAGEVIGTSAFDAVGEMESSATVSSEGLLYNRSALFEAVGGMASSAIKAKWRPRHTRSQIMLEGNLRPTSNLATWSDRLELYDSETGQPIDLVEQVVAISMALRDIYTGTVVLKGDLLDGTVWVVNPGLIEWSFPPETMAGLDPKAYDVGCLVEMAGETIQVLLGHLSVKRGL